MSIPSLDERPAAEEHARYQDPYVARVPRGRFLEQFTLAAEETLSLLLGPLAQHGDLVYAPGKWSVKQVAGHITDTERIMTYRALRFARGDATDLPGFDENLFAAGGGFEKRTIEDLAHEFRTVRTATISFLQSLPPEALLRSGRANGHHLTVRGLAYVIAGHGLHHTAILKERYLPAVERLR